MSDSLDFIFERANSALITQDFEYAERLLTNVLKKHPDILPSDKEKIENLLARVYGDEGNLEQSLATYLYLYERAPDNIELMLNLGRIYRHLERYEEALKILEKAQAIGGDTDEVLYSLAKTYKKMGEYAKSAEYFSRAIEVKPDHAHAYDRLGNLYVLTGETDKAIEIYKQGLRVDSNHPYLNFHLAGLLCQEKRYEEAIVYYNSALRVNPAWGEVLTGIAAAYLQLDKLDDALNTYRSLLRIAGENAPLYTKLGYLLEKKQRYNEALPILLAAESAPVNTDNHALRLKAIQMCIYAKDYAKAHELFGRLDTEHNNSLNALKLRGELYALTGEVERAEETFRQILNIAPSAIEFRQELAEQYLLAHKYEEAKEQLRLFLKQKPIDISALMALGRTEELLNNPQAAYQEYQKVLELKPNAIEARSALSRLFQKWGNTLEALKTANEILNLQSGSETDEHEQDMAASLDLYERAAESYIADPLLTKNLEQLKSDDSHLYISPAELNPEPARRIPSLQDMVMSERELPFEMLIEGTEEVQELPPEKDESAIGTMQLTGDMQSGISGRSVFPKYSDTAPTSYDGIAGSSDATMPAASPGNTVISQSGNNSTSDQFRTADSAVFTAPIDELYLNPENAENDAALGIGTISQQNAKTLHKRQNLLRDDAMQERLKEVDTYSTSIEFLQSIISDVDKQFDENRYAQVVEVLAERIAENLSRKIPLQPAALKEALADQQVQQELQESEKISQAAAEAPIVEAQEALPAAEEDDLPVNKNASMDEDEPVHDDTVQVIETPEEALLSVEENEAIPLGTDSIPIVEIADGDVAASPIEESKGEEATGEAPDVQSNSHHESSDEITVDNDDEPFIEASDSEDEAKQSANQEPFVLDQEQQNLLWCHAKHQVKDSPSFEEYLNTADPERLAQLFLYLRDLFTYLPQEELEIFLNSSERIQIYYIIARLSGELGLKEHANLIQQAYSVVTAQPPYNDEAIFKLLTYLRDLSIALPDQELGTRVRQELEQLMANMSSLLPDLS